MFCGGIILNSMAAYWAYWKPQPLLQTIRNHCEGGACEALTRCLAPTPTAEFRQWILRGVADGVLLDRQRMERGLLRKALSGYASVYNVNTCFQFVGEKCSRLARGARG